MEDVRNLKISDAEKNRLLIKRLNNRPNAMATYGQAKLTPEQMKDIFDQQFEMLVGKYNELCELLARLNEIYATDEELEGVKGVSGQMTILSSNWGQNVNGITVTKRFTELGENDVILIYPSTPADRDAMTKAGVYVATENIGQSVTFFAEEKPDNDISVMYFIVRGAA